MALPARAVGHALRPSERAPLLGSHYRTVIAPTGPSAPVPRIGTQPLVFQTLAALPSAADHGHAPSGPAAARDDRFPRSVRKPGPGSRRLYAGRRLGRMQGTPDSSRGRNPTSVLTSSEEPFDTKPAIRSRSPSWPLPDAITSHLFPQRSARTALDRRTLRWFAISSCWGDREGPTLIFRTAPLRVGPRGPPFCVRGARFPRFGSGLTLGAWAASAS